MPQAPTSVLLLIISSVLLAEVGTDQRQCIQKGTYKHCTREPRFKNCSQGKFSPLAIIENKTFSAAVGSNFSMICIEKNIHASFPYFDWVKWGTTKLDIDYGSFQVVSHKSNPNYSIQSVYDYDGDLMASRLIIFNITASHQGHYGCVICTPYGRNISTVFLSVFENPVTSPGATSLPTSRSSPSGESGTNNRKGNTSDISPAVLAVVVVIALLVALVIIFVATRWWRKHLKFGGSRQQPPSMSNPTYKPPDGELRLGVTRGRFPSETSTVSSVASSAPLLRPSHNRSPLCSNTSAISAITEFSYTDDLPEYEVDEEWEIDRSCLLMKEQVGEGAFGAVCRATAFGLPGMPQQCTVAVKMLKETAGDSDLVDLIAEIETMKKIGHHKNIVNLIGTCTVDGPILLVVDFAPHGNLREFLRKRRPSESAFYQTQGAVTQKDLLSFAFQVARGMVFLSSKKCIHRDLAARNILVAKDYVMKISDFGLSRNLINTDYYKKTSHGRLPVKWLPPEALFDQQYTVQSDVWSYGILLWEIFTMGATPYPGIEVENLFALLKNGYRMEAPSECPQEIYNLMLQCWKNNPKERLTFPQIEREFEKLLQASSGQEYLEVLAKPEDLTRAARDSSLSKTSTKAGRVTRDEKRV